MSSAVVVGGGVLGLSIALRMQQVGFEVVLCEKMRALGTEMSSRNSGVIHAGLYYPEGSLMARHCRRGKDMLYDYLLERPHIPFERCGKLVIATADEDIHKLEAILRTGQRNGVSDLRMVSWPEVRAMEPALTAATAAALLSPSTGVLDQHAFMASLQHEAEEAGVVMALDTCIDAVEEAVDSGSGGGGGGGGGGRFVVRSKDKGDLQCDVMVNAAGLAAPWLAARTKSYPPALVPSAYYAKGSWYRVACKTRPFSRLVYPLPEPGGLGVHATLIIGEESLRFGPDVEWLTSAPVSSQDAAGCVDPFAHSDPPDPRTAYAVEDSAAHRRAFYTSIAKYYPALREEQLVPDYSGIRAKLVGPDGRSTGGCGRSTAQLRDFVIEDSSTHGVQGLVNLFGVQSPGLTSSMSIAHDVADMLLRDVKS